MPGWGGINEEGSEVFYDCNRRFQNVETSSRECVRIHMCVTARSVEPFVCLPVEAKRVCAEHHVGDQRGEGIAQMPQTRVGTPENMRIGIKVPVTGLLFAEHFGPCQMHVLCHRKSKGVVLPVVGKVIRRDPVFGLHLVPQARARERSEEHDVERVKAVALGGRCDFPADMLLVNVQSYDERSHNTNAVLLDTPYRGLHVASVLQVEFLVDFDQSFLTGRFKPDENAETPGL